MSNHQNDATTKVAYTKPTLIEYGSLAERTKIFGLLNPDETDPDARRHSTTTIVI
jgi:hypothetical protein